MSEPPARAFNSRREVAALGCQRIRDRSISIENSLADSTPSFFTRMVDIDLDDPLFSLSLRPGGTTSLFSGFGKGAGFGVKPLSQVRWSRRRTPRRNNLHEAVPDQTHR